MTAQLSSIRQKMEKHEMKQDVRVNDIKQMLKVDIKVQAANEMKLVSLLELSGDGRHLTTLSISEGTRSARKLDWRS